MNASARLRKNLAEEKPDKAKQMMALLAQQQKKYGDRQALTSANPNPAKIGLEFFKKAGPAKKKKRKKP